MNAQASPSPIDAEAMPLLKFYQDSIEAWTKSCERMLQGLQEAQKAQVQSAPAPEARSAPEVREERGPKATPPTPANDAAMGLAQWRRSSDEFFRGFVNQQIELCRFFGSRWHEYLSLPDQLAHCKTAAEVGRVQAAFMTRFASDYMRETGKLSQPLGKVMTELASTQRGESASGW